MKQALGMIEVRGFATAVKVADVMAKVANIDLIETKMTRGGGWMAVFIEGDVGAVQASIQAGRAEAQSQAAFIAAKVIPRPIKDLDLLFLDSRKVSSSLVAKPAEILKEEVTVSPVRDLVVPENNQSVADELELESDSDSAPQEESQLPTLVENRGSEEMVVPSPTKSKDELPEGTKAKKSRKTSNKKTKK